MIRTKPARVPERIVQRQVVHLLRSVGGQVYVIGTTRPKGDRPGTMQTPGIPDLYVLLPDAPWRTTPDSGGFATAGSKSQTCAHGLWVEVKATGGRLRPAQAEFARLCVQAGCPHVVGGVDAVLTYLQDHGYVKETAHYRRTA